MIPSIFARSVEKEIWVLGICADYLEDNGKDGSILRIIAENPFLLDDSGYSNDSINGSNGSNGYGHGYGDGIGYGSIYGDGDGHGDSYGIRNVLRYAIDRVD